MTFNGPTLRIFECPQCKKRRMNRSADHVVITEKKDVSLPDGRTAHHYIDVCDFCAEKIRKQYYQPTKKDIKKVLKALHDPSVELGDESLENML